MNEHTPCPTQTSARHRKYRYDFSGNRKSFRDLNGGDLSEAYEYDGLSRLRTMLRGGMNTNHQLTGGPAAPVMGAAEWVDMDLRGNWTNYREYVENTEQLDWTYSETRTHDPANAILARSRDFDGPNGAGGGSGSPESFATAYDPRGNLASDQVHGYGYDEENRLTRVCRWDPSETYCGSAPGELEIEYDVLGRVVRRTVSVNYNERTFRYVYDGLSYAVIQEWEDGIGAGGAPGLLREFVYAGSHIEPVTMIDYTDAGAETAGTAETYHYLRDERNCVVALLDDTGTVAESYRYDPYGRTYVWAGEAEGAPDRVWSADAWTESDNDPRPNPLSPSYLGNPFGFTGHRFSAAGLFETPFRAYSPTLGRWLQRDPLEYVDGPSMVAYLRGHPLRLIDPFGLAPNKGQVSSPRDILKDIEEAEKTEDDPIKILQQLEDKYRTNTDPRYVWTDRYSYIDLLHFFGTAQRALRFGNFVAMMGGEWNESRQAAKEAEARAQGQEPYRSAYSWEDLRSNHAGLLLANAIRDAKSGGNLKLSDIVKTYLEAVGARSKDDPLTPLDAIPDEDPARPGDPTDITQRPPGAEPRKGTPADDWPDCKCECPPKPFPYVDPIEPE